MDVTYLMMTILGFGMLSTLSVNTAPTQEGRPPARATIADVAWLEDVWVLDGTSVNIEERWMPPAGGAMLGVSRTVKGDRMVAFEFLRIVERDGGLVYVAQPNGRPFTEFVLTAAGPRTATFENPAHDFPKLISYTLREDGTLEVRISDGGERGQRFAFTRRPAGTGKTP
jgi:hypothetical protein